jgi:hypothetical protein
MLLQIHHATTVHYRYRTRRLDLYDYKGFVLDILNLMKDQIAPDGASLADVAGDQPLFILAGYSWRQARFALWTLHLDPAIAAFTFREHVKWAGVDGRRKAAFIGDSVPEAKEQLTHLLARSGKLAAGGLDFEPFEVLRDIIRAGSAVTVGGPPQLVKIYRHLNVAPFGVFWPQREGGTPTLFGRPLMNFEKPDTGFLDPDTLKVWRLDGSAGASA